MPPWIQIFLLAVLQGVTEFIPVSSSGHLVIARHLLGVEAPGLVLELVLHAGSLISILFFFRRRLFDLGVSLARTGGEGRRYAALILLGSIPAGTLGLLFNERISRLFESAAITAWMLLVTSLILLSSGLRPRSTAYPLNWRKSLWIGFGQALAILPGISRSGTTITIGRRLGLSHAEAAEFSFVLSIPVLTGVSLLMMRKLGAAQAAGWTPAMLLFGMLVSAVTGYFALGILMRVLRSGRFWVFGIYCLIAGTILLATSI